MKKRLVQATWGTLATTGAPLYHLVGYYHSTASAIDGFMTDWVFGREDAKRTIRRKKMVFSFVEE